MRDVKGTNSLLEPERVPSGIHNNHASTWGLYHALTPAKKVHYQLKWRGHESIFLFVDGPKLKNPNEIRKQIGSKFYCSSNFLRFGHRTSLGGLSNGSYSIGSRPSSPSAEWTTPEVSKESGAAVALSSASIGGTESSPATPAPFGVDSALGVGKVVPPSASKRIEWSLPGVWTGIGVSSRTEFSLAVGNGKEMPILLASSVTIAMIIVTSWTFERLWGSMVKNERSRGFTLEPRIHYTNDWRK